MSANAQPMDALAYIRVSVTNPITQAMKEITRGSGFLIDKTGHIITAKHVVMAKEMDGPGPRRISVSLRYKEATPVTAQVVACDDDNIDLCLIKVQDAAVVAAQITDVFKPVCRALTVGERIVALGFPFGDGNPAIRVPGDITGSLATDLKYPSTVPILPGMSGGPVLDNTGNVVAVNTGASAQFPTMTFVQPLFYGKPLVGRSGISCEASNPGAADDKALSAESLLATVSALTPVDARKLEESFELIYDLVSRQETTSTGARKLVEALVERSSPEWMPKFSDTGRRNLWRVLGAVRKDWWSLTDWMPLKLQARQNLAIYEGMAAYNNMLPSAQANIALDQYKSRLDYVVPPGRIVIAAPFRIRMDYCAAAKCDVEIILRGYDERGNLRYDSSGTFSQLVGGEYRDTTLNSVHAMYFEYNQQLVSNKNVLFKLYCRYGGSVVEGKSEAITWSAGNEIFNGYSTWLSCGTPAFQASLGLGVHPAINRGREPPVKIDTGPPR